jgi:large subunit ribosomal protein L25
VSGQDILLTLENREVVGKGVKKLREAGMVPVVVHNHGKDSTHAQAAYMDVFKVYKQAGKHHPVSLTIDGKKHLTIIKDATFEPRKNQLQHVVFNSIRQNQPVNAEVPIVFQGDSEAEKAGLMILHQLEHLEVQALPKNLPDELIVDISSLVELGDKLHVSDIKIPEGVTLLTEPEHALAIVEESRAQAAAAEEAEEAEAAAEAAAEEAKTADATPATETAAPTE